jgi:hypothetical protein
VSRIGFIALGIMGSPMAAVRAQGYGALDHSALLKVLEALSGQARPPGGGGVW